MNAPTSPEHAAYTVLTTRLDQYRAYLTDNTTADFAATQVLDELERIVVDADTAALVVQCLGTPAEGGQS